MKNLFVSLFFVTLSAASSYGKDAPKIECYGPKDAKHFVVYLHGMDTNPPGEQEENNRMILKKLSDELKIQFAFPRATEQCPTNSDQFCWTWLPEYKADLKLALDATEASAKECFPYKKFSLLGFSNGGVAASSFLRLCMKTEIENIIVVGASGLAYLNDPEDLSDCHPELISILGKKDKANFNRGKTFVKGLVKRKAKAKVIEFNGGHILPEKEIKSILKTLAREADKKLKTSKKKK